MKKMIVLFLGNNLVRHARRQPIAFEQRAHRRVAVDAAQKVVLLCNQHLVTPRKRTCIVSILTLPKLVHARFRRTFQFRIVEGSPRVMAGAADSSFEEDSFLCGGPGGLEVG